MTDNTIHKFLTYCLAAIWIANGLFCKMLNLVPRHQQIVARILGTEHSRLLIIVIGFSEILMAIWIISSIKSKLNSIVQILIIATMNILEFVLAPDLLLWGKANAIFALILIVVIYFNEFYLNKKSGQQR
jgi:uncharacterized membrane protein YphA (DoxX/SURF4 family)